MDLGYRALWKSQRRRDYGADRAFKFMAHPETPGVCFINYLGSFPLNWFDNEDYLLWGHSGPFGLWNTFSFCLIMPCLRCDSIFLICQLSTSNSSPELHKYAFESQTFVLLNHRCFILRYGKFFFIICTFRKMLFCVSHHLFQFVTCTPNYTLDLYTE